MLRFLLEKEFKQLFRNSFLPRLLIFQPLLMMLVMPYTTNQEVRQVRLAIVDNDHSTTSQRLVYKTTATDHFILASYATSYSDALRSVEAGDADLILSIAPDFERDLVNIGQGNVFVASNATNGVKASLGASYLLSVIADYSRELNAERGLPQAVERAVPAFSMVSQYRFNPHLDYKAFMIPALMVSLLTMLCGFLPALNIVGEKEKGTIEQINVTPVRHHTFILSKLILYWLIGFLVLSLCMGIAVLIYGLVPVGSLWLIYLFAGIFISLVSAVGLVISNYSNTQQQAMFVMYFFMLIFLLMSGQFTPTTSMPTWAQYIAAANPLKYFVEVMRMLYLKGSAFSDLLPHLGYLSAFAIGFGLWAILSYRKTN